MKKKKKNKTGINKTERKQVLMSEEATKTTRQPKDPELTKIEQALNKGISERLREKYKEWAAGKPKKENSYNAIAAAIYAELTVTVSEESVKKHLGGKNTSQVSLPLLCWYATKFGTSVNYLLTKSETPPKQKVSKENATPADVLDALQLLLEVFEPSLSLGYSYKCEYYIDETGELQRNSDKQIRTISIEDNKVQKVLHWWDLYQKTANSQEEDRLELKDLLFSKHVEEFSRQPWKLINGTFLYKDVQYAFLKKDNPYYSNENNSTDRRKDLLIPVPSWEQYYFTRAAYKDSQTGNTVRFQSFANGSEWSLQDVDKNEIEIANEHFSLDELPF